MAADDMDDDLKKELTDVSNMKFADSVSEDDQQAIRFILQCRNEAKVAKWNRTMQTRENYDVFWGRHDFAHKKPGQSRETLTMQAMAVEQTSSFFQQALVDMGDEWWRAAAKDGRNESKQKVPSNVVQAITQMQLMKAKILRQVGLLMKSGLLGGSCIVKAYGEYENCPIYVAERSEKKRVASLKKAVKKYWKLRLDVVSSFNFYEDPTPNQRKLYQIEDMWVDLHEMYDRAEGDDAIYDMKVCELVNPGGDDGAEEKFEHQRRSNQNETSHAFRGRVKITEFWGTILDVDGKVIKENCVATLANDRYLIRKPTANPNWSQRSPYLSVPLLDSPDTTNPKALADAGSKYNIAANELFNLMLDGAMRSVNGVNQLRQDWLEDPSQVEGGIGPGTNLGVNSQCPPGAKVLEQLTTGQVPADSLQLFNLLMQEFNRAMLTSDIRQGVMPKRDVSATQIVSTDQNISSVFNGMSKQVEQGLMQELLELAWMTSCQYSDEMNPAELQQIMSADEYDNFMKLTPEERFAETVGGIHFDVFGISLQLQKAQDFKKVMTLLQSIGGSEPMTEAFVKRFSFDETLAFAMRALGLPIKQLEIPQDEQDQMQGAPQGQAPAPAQSGAPNQMSQVPSPNSGSIADQLGSAAGPQAIAKTQGGPQ